MKENAEEITDVFEVIVVLTVGALFVTLTLTTVLPVLVAERADTLTDHTPSIPGEP